MKLKSRVILILTILMSLIMLLGNIMAVSAAPVFTDIAGHIAEDDINFLAQLGIVDSTGSGEFKPDAPMTRAMMVTAIAREAGVDTDLYVSSSFIDIAHDSWFRPYAEWAYKSGFVQDSGNHEFRPNDAVTAEQLEDIFNRYAGWKGIEMEVSWECRFVSSGGITRGEAAQEIAAFIKACEDGVIGEDDIRQPAPVETPAPEPEPQDIEINETAEPVQAVSYLPEGNSNRMLIGAIVLAVLAIGTAVYCLSPVYKKDKENGGQ